MFMWKSLSVGLFLLVCTCACQAQYSSSEYEGGRYEITPFVGTRFGGQIDLSQSGNPNVDYLKIKSSIDYGIMADVSFWGNFQGEFMWNRQPTSLTSHDPITETLTPVSNMNLDMYHFSVLYNFLSPERKLRPFVVAAWDSRTSGLPRLTAKTRSASATVFPITWEAARNTSLPLIGAFGRRFVGLPRTPPPAKRPIATHFSAAIRLQSQTRRSRVKRTLESSIASSRNRHTDCYN